MLTRQEQKDLYQSLLGNLTINTKIDGSGNNVSIPLYISWGFEPKEQVFPLIVLRFIYRDQPYLRTITDYLGDRGNGVEFGYMGQSGLLIKIKCVDFGSKEAGNFISKYDIAEEISKRIQQLAITGTWDGIVKDGSVNKESGIVFNDVSEILELEAIHELQTIIPIKKLVSYKPIETGIVKFINAPTLLTLEFQDVELIIS